MVEVPELRYPFDSLYEFISGGYWTLPSGWPLTIGGVLYVLLAWRVIRQTRNVFLTLLVLYLATPLFNNPAYTLAGLDVSQIMGLIATGVFLLSRCLRPTIRPAPITGTMLVLWAVCSIHAGIVVILTPELQPTIFLRTVLLGKIAVLGVALCAFTHFANERLIRVLLRAQAGAVLIASLVYLMQGVSFLSGTVPYGTYWDAGFTGVPSFGGVSIERGHLGKFLVPSIPLLLLYAYLTRNRWSLRLGVGVSLINFSASAFAFLASYAVLYSLLFRRWLLHPRRWPALLAGASVVTGMAVYFGAQYGGIITKIVRAGILSDDEGGRSVSLLWTYLMAYPLGTSYGGSSLRVAPDLPEINMGAFVWVSQLSLLALPLLALIIFLHVRIWRKARPHLDLPTRRILLGGMIVAGIISAVDVLWFVPTLWLPITLCAVLPRCFHHHNIERPLRLTAPDL